MSMKYRVAYICELGSDNDQLARLYDITKECNAAGYDVAVVVRDIVAVSAVMNKVHAAVFQAPVFLPRLRLNRQLVCLADTLQLAGYEHGNTLLPLVQAWQALLGLLQADVLVFDHAPTALLAASNLHCRKVVVGNGYSIPVAGHKLADWQPMQSRAELIQEQEDNVLKVINQVQRKLELPISAAISELYRCDRVVINHFPQLDVYRQARANADYYTSVASFRPPVFSFRQAEKPRIICWLDPAYKKFTPLVEALRACGCEILLVFAGGDSTRLKPYEATLFQATTLVPDLELLIREADMFIGHGSLGALTTAMRLGKPMLLLPMQLEQLHAGLGLQAMGIAKVLTDQDNASAYQQAVIGVLGNIRLRTAARNFATNNRIYGYSTFGKGVIAAFADDAESSQQTI